LVPNKHQSRRKVKPTNSDADYAANKDSEDQDELADNTAKSENMADAHGSEGPAADEGEEDGEEQGNEEDEEAAEEETSKAPPKKAAKGAAAGKAKVAPAAAPAPAVSPLFVGPRKSLVLSLFLAHPIFLPALNAEAVQELLVELVGHSLVAEAAKPPFLNKGPPACTNCISRRHKCQPAKTGHTNRCQRCQDGHMVCSRGRTTPELLATFECLRPILAVTPSSECSIPLFIFY
jgi:hypothetical protein